MKQRILGGGLLGILFCLVTATPASAKQYYRFFDKAEPSARYYGKIRDWQNRQTLELSQTDVSEMTFKNPLSWDFHRKWLGKVDWHPMTDSRRTNKLRRYVGWIQLMSISYYKSDKDHDHWATLGETLSRPGDDCDGLNLLTFYFLKDLEQEGFRAMNAVIYKESDYTHHMVTLLFEEGSKRPDPLVFDPTGVATPKLKRFSKMSRWIPAIIFDEREIFVVNPI